MFQLPDVSRASSLELERRAGEMLDRLDALLRELGPRIEEVGKLRGEIELVRLELDRRDKEKDVGR